jgi:hypothetical protein
MAILWACLAKLCELGRRAWSFHLVIEAAEKISSARPGVIIAVTSNIDRDRLVLFHFTRILYHYYYRRRVRQLKKTNAVRLLEGRG